MRRVAAACLLAGLLSSLPAAQAFANERDGEGEAGVDVANATIAAAVWTNAGGWSGPRTSCSFQYYSSALLAIGRPHPGISKIEGGFTYALYLRKCPGSVPLPDVPELVGERVWIPILPDTPVTSGIIPVALDEVRKAAPAPALASAPPNNSTFVNLGMWFWTTTPATPVTATASVPVGRGWRWVTVTATPVRLVFEPGDGRYGSGPVTCAAPGTVWVEEFGDETFSPAGCEYKYTHSSVMAPNGESFPARLSMEWDVTWRSSTGRSGTLTGFSTQGPVQDIEVKEIQAIVTA